MDSFSLHINRFTSLESAFIPVISSNVPKLDLFFDCLLTEISELLSAIFAHIPRCVNLVKCNLEVLNSDTAKVLCHALQVLPHSVSGLEIALSRLQETNDQSLEVMFSSLPRSIVSLKLAVDYIEAKCAKGMCQGIKLLPSSIRELALCVNKLAQQNNGYLVELFSAIPFSVVSLNLARNSFGFADQNQICAALNSLPHSIVSLNLSYNHLYIKNGASLLELFAAIPRSVLFLNLSDNELGLEYQENVLAQAMTALPQTIRELSLARNQLGQKTPVSLAAVFFAVPRAVTWLNLEQNGFGEHMSAQGMLQAFSAISLTVTSLNLAKNAFFLKRGDELVHALSHLPRRLTLLNLKNNGLGMCARTFISNYEDSDAQRGDLDLEDYMSQLIAAIPPSLTSLNLSGNALALRRGDELAKIFKYLPSSLKELDLGFNGFNQRTPDELKKAFAVLKKGVYLSLHGNKLFNRAMSFNTVARLHARRDVLLHALNPSSLMCNIDLSFNGESEFQRALCPMVSLLKILRLMNLSTDLLVYILSFLTQKRVSLQMMHQAVLELSSKIENRPHHRILKPTNSSLTTGDNEEKQTIEHQSIYSFTTKPAHQILKITSNYKQYT